MKFGNKLETDNSE